MGATEGLTSAEKLIWLFKFCSELKTHRNGVDFVISCKYYLPGRRDVVFYISGSSELDSLISDAHENIAKNLKMAHT